MPSPRSVLIDIAEKNLDPEVAHARVGANGRLRSPTDVEIVEEQPVEVEAEKTVKSGLVELADAPVVKKEPKAKKKQSVDDA